MISRLYRSFERNFIKSGWVILFILLCYLGYEHGLSKRNEDYSKLYSAYQELQKEKKALLAEQENLSLQINSQSDPDYVELTLMKGLGLVADGQKKVLFTDQKDLLNPQ